MIEIIPNWHPVFVHFTIGLIIVAAGLHVLTLLLPRSSDMTSKIVIAANLNLWIGAALTLITITAGWLAFESVNHDTPSHIAMKDHRNWGFGTTAILVVTALLSYVHARKHVELNKLVIVLMIVTSSLLIVTGWKGSELVYRHGLGVMSLPKSDKHDHAAHDHSQSDDHTQINVQDAKVQTGHSNQVEHEHHDDDIEHEHVDTNTAGEANHLHSDNEQHQHAEPSQTQEKSAPHSDGHDHKH